MVNLETKKKIMLIAKAASAKKSLDTVIIDMKKMPNISDYFIVTSGTSTTQVRAISDNIMHVMSEAGQKTLHAEGEREALWILLDYGDVVVHVFNDSTRRFYDLERLWADAPQRSFKETVPVSKKKRASKVKKPAAKKKKAKIIAKRRSKKRK